MTHSLEQTLQGHESKTPTHDEHVGAGRRTIDWRGWDKPLRGALTLVVLGEKKNTELQPQKNKMASGRITSSVSCTVSTLSRQAKEKV